jgi:hypothetical protein
MPPRKSLGPVDDSDVGVFMLMKITRGEAIYHHAFARQSMTMPDWFAVQGGRQIQLSLSTAHAAE